MRRKIVAGNWKMHGGVDLVSDFSRVASDLCVGGGEVVIAPPFPFLISAVEALSGSLVRVAGQNVAIAEDGPFTGEVSARMLADAGCSYCIVGHSERRMHFGETDRDVCHKIERLTAAGITPIVCVGESLGERESGLALNVIERQVRAALEQGLCGQRADLVIAYEPVWAIGTGKVASPEQVQEVHAHIRSIVRHVAGDVAALVPILYGGSVKSTNAGELFAQQDVDGGLIGGASLDVSEFGEICKLLS